jgi:hypothetical protein
VVGLLLFLAIGALPAVVYGGYAGVVAVGSLFVTGGAVTGAAIGMLASRPAPTDVSR